MSDTGADDGRPTVLVVDDETDTADIYTDILGGEYDVRTAYSGEEALELADSDVSVVLLDRRMPELSGDEVLKELRARDYDCRVVMVTAIDPDIDIIDLQFDDYLVKPVSADELRDAVERMLARNDHDDKIREAIAVASKMATLESKMEIAELEASQEYAELDRKFEELREDIGTVQPVEGEDLYGEFKTEKIRSLFGL